MKKNKLIFSIIFTLLCFVPILSIKAINSDDVYYSVENYVARAEMEISGNLHIREVIKVHGSFNGYKRNISAKNNDLEEFHGTTEGLKGSKLYNGTDVEIYKVGKLDIEEIDYKKFNQSFVDENVTYFEEVESALPGDKDKYTIAKSGEGSKEIKMFYETEDDTTYFYIDYLVTNILVEHKDSAEFYYTFVSEEWADDIKEMHIIVDLPDKAQDLFKVWGHGYLGATIYLSENKDYVIAEAYEKPAYQSFDVRILFDKSLFMININESKKSNLDAIDAIVEIETQRADEANNYRKYSQMKLIIFYGLESIYIVGVIILGIYIYKKYDKEHKSNFVGEYFREINDKYPVETVEYIMNSNFSNKGFSASILLMIYKKIITLEENTTDKKKKEYTLIFNKKLEDKLTKSEQIITDVIFNEIGDGTKVTLKEIERFSKKTDSNGNNKLNTAFNTWKTECKQVANELNIYENNSKMRKGFALYSLIGFLLVGFDYLTTRTMMFIITGIVALIFLIYIFTLKKRTVFGNDEYNKWKGFKKFLNDFGRFNEKELPEIKIWEKYLVYASLFGLADKVQKAMAIKFSEIRPDYNMDTGDIMFNYFMFSNLTDNISNSISNSVSSSVSAVVAAKSEMASGSGSGGGFSSGGGFGGGGNSGGGF